MKILKKLKSKERGLTRTLWEQVFTEDTKEFLDYYYTEKTKNNEIYVIETDHDIRAMMQLYPRASASPSMTLFLFQEEQSRVQTTVNCRC